MKYAYTGKHRWKDCNRKFGSDDLTRDKYYAWQRHRAQAKFRGETYELSFEDWCWLWEDHLWARRGRRVDDLCLTRYDYAGEWALHNVTVCTRREHFNMKANGSVG